MMFARRRGSRSSPRERGEDAGRQMRGSAAFSSLGAPHPPFGLLLPVNGEKEREGGA